MSSGTPPRRSRVFLTAVVLAGIGFGMVLWVCCGIGETALSLLAAFTRY